MSKSKQKAREKRRAKHPEGIKKWSAEKKKKRLQKRREKLVQRSE